MNAETPDAKLREPFSVVARSGGRYVREWPVGSRYAAKQKRKRLAAKYCDVYVLTIERSHAWSDRR